MPRLEPEIAPPAVTFIVSLIATVSGMILIFGLPVVHATAHISDALSQPVFGNLFAIGIIALPLLIMLGSLFWLTIALLVRSRPAR